MRTESHYMFLSTGIPTGKMDKVVYEAAKKQPSANRARVMLSNSEETDSKDREVHNDAREKEFYMALQQLTPVFQRKLAAKHVCHDLYGMEQLTWNEYECIGEVERDVA